MTGSDETPKPAVPPAHTSGETKELKSAFDKERYDRARMHMGNLGDVHATEPMKQYRPSLLTPFFGANEIDPKMHSFEGVHPCKVFASHVHLCLRAHENNSAFCQTHIATLQQCLREFKM